MDDQRIGTCPISDRAIRVDARPKRVTRAQAASIGGDTLAARDTSMAGAARRTNQTRL